MTVRILLLEDNDADAELVEVELRRAELDFTARRVVTRPDFERALRAFLPDIIASDRQLPQFSGVAALALASARAPHAPFILLTGSRDEETAVEYMKAGAADYILKGRLTRLGPAVRGALERERMKRQLREREEYFKSLIEQAMDIIAVLDADGAVRYASPSVLPLLGYGAEELVGQHIFDLVHPDDIGPALWVFAEGVATGQGDRLLGLQVRHKDGTYRSLEAIGRYLLDDPVVRGVVINARDVTERRSLERQLLQAQKMEAVGRLAGGIAHDFNNILTAIFGYADLLTEEFPAGSPARQDLEEIRKAATRASALTRQLLAFSRQQVLAPVVLSVNDLVADVDKMLRLLVGEDVELRLILARDAGNVRADSGQLQQVIMNLVVNARDAMPTGGTLVIETADAELTEQYAELHQAVIPGRYVMLAVSDTGVGMDAQTKARIFEPFFTTKEKGKGTGLGLSTVYGIVKQSGGYVWVYSELGHGTTFKLFFPRVDAAAEPPAPPRETATLTGRETILLAEDDEM